MKVPEEYFYDNGADDTHLPGFLDSIKGSLSSERRESRPKNPNIQLKKLRRLNDQFRLRVSDIFQNPQLITDRMASKAALYPNFASTDFKIRGIQNLQGKGQYRKILNILLAIYSLDDEWIKFYLAEPFLRLIPREPKPGIQSELHFIIKILVTMDSIQRQDLLSKIYSKHNLKQKIENGKFWIERLNFTIEFFDTTYVKIAQRKRGYNDKGSSNPIHTKRRNRCMTEIQEEIEIRRQRILAKQMEIFERNLDRLLELESSDTRKEAKKIIRNQNLEVQELQEQLKPKNSILGGKYYEEVNDERN